jgi:23S rRNA pseudouridine2605 synthase
MRSTRPPSPGTRRIGVARVLSKAGLCSRSEAALRVAAGRVAINGRVVRDPEHPVESTRDRVSVDGVELGAVERVYLALNKPRGLVTTAQDERGRDTVYRCLDDVALPWLAPVGRLDRASEGLLLFSNDPEWSAHVTDPATGPDKTYHVQVDVLPEPALIAGLQQGVTDAGEHLSAKAARMLRSGERNAWLEIVLEEGRNRQIRRLLQAFDVGVLRLVRVAIGTIVLGDLAKGRWRRLSEDEARTLAPLSSASSR